jgi:hypothetical protein
MEAIEMSGSLAKGAFPSVPVVVDALPYIDLGYDEAGVREAVRTLRSVYTKNDFLVVRHRTCNRVKNRLSIR